MRDGERQDVRSRPSSAATSILHADPRAGAPLGVQIIRPGGMLPPRLALTMHHHDLPDDMSVTITKHGKEPAKIKVEQGDKTWEVTENTLDELPEIFGRMSNRWWAGWRSSCLPAWGTC